ncbi:uncharacterized protein GGS22DRAFT_156910 [Annulohypoxylon maeteangense]|uniref:uncharacterized protein n=1 Tax=Annulohypoxylon maeteangense TaxID=1927788 RepID=UPI002008602C|nr:uncharacterized protein GGS22DRAFT_156910 [Annulohypoxylon maeteangense]KAI0887380.1 hypothetical protein GGS22DRAFT_156910 [Annulohypoxylon maeteangense]
MSTLTPICRGCSRPILLLRNSLQSIKPYNQTTRVPQWLQPNCARISRRSYAMKVPPPYKATVGKIPPKSTKLKSGQETAKTLPQPIRSEKPTVVSHPVVPQLGFAKGLANNPKPTTLYEAASQRMFLFSSYLAGFSCLLGAATNIIVNVYNIPEGMHFLMPVAFGAVGIIMAIIGTRFALIPAGVVRYIKVLPAQSIKSSNPAMKSTPVSSLPVRLEIEVRRSLPFMYRRFEVDPKDVVMVAPMYYMAAHDQPDQSLLPRDGLFKNIRRGITGEGLAPIMINDVKYKLDITSAYVLDEGRALDRIVRIEKTPAVERLLAQKKSP